MNDCGGREVLIDVISGFDFGRRLYNLGIPYRRRPTINDEPCEKKHCKFNGDCFEENRRPTCRCPTNCKEHYNPVCASDGLTYNTECQMRVDSCRKKKKIYVRHEGLCSYSEFS
ncbi:UNVERIFIED_CONTAM: Fstl5 [Trichonephila clavipes]